MTADKDIKIAWFNFLKVFTRGLAQINLYKPDHAQITQVLKEAHALLGPIIADSPDNKFTLALDNDNLIVNGFPLLTASKLPTSLKNIFASAKTSSISFLAGVSQNDILLLYQMQALNGDSREYLKQNNIDKITLSQSVFMITDKSDARTERTQPPEDYAAGEHNSATADNMAETIAPQNFETAIDTIVGKTTRNAAEQKHIMGIVMSKFQAELEAQINKALLVVRQEKKKMESDIARTEAVISNIAEGVVVVDKDGKILMMNPQAEVISGKCLSDLSGRKIFDIANLENQLVSLAWEISRDGAKKSESSGSGDLRSGFSEAVKKSTAIIQDEDGKIVGSLSIPTDKTKFLEIEKLQQDFMANMTHELRSPLTSIKAALELLAKGIKSDDPGKSMINTAIRNSERLNAIITDILDFSKLQSGKMVFHPEKTPSDEIVKEAADSMKAWSASKSLILTVKIEPGVPHVYVDKRRTVQILINLISNAIKFTPKGGAIELSADKGRDAQSGFVFFSVKDTGCGIRKEDQSKIFDKFVQVSAGEKTAGTGLGLTITKAMAVMQGGRIMMESDQGRGSTFRVALPAYNGQLETPVFEPLPAVTEKNSWWKKLLGI